MISVKINGIKFLVKSQTTILETCKYLGIYIPRFCYHETLSVAGNCRMCLVEIEGAEKPVASCVAEVEEGMSIWIDSPFVKKARENVMETLLINHPLDCPICDQGGECDLQDQAKTFGSDRTRYFFNKRGVEDKECGPLIKTIMTRCIHCTRCVRYGSEVAGLDYLGTLNRGTGTEIGSYVSKIFESEISGNVIDLCPVGALTSKPYAFKSRPWELRLTETVDTTDSLGSNIYVNFKETEVFRILPKNNSHINDSFIDDKTRFSYDSIKNNRIQDIFSKKKSGFQRIDWRKLFDIIDNLINNKKISVIINDEIGLEALTILRSLQYKSKNILNVMNINENYSKNNLIINDNASIINSIHNSTDICLLFAANPKLESSILNAKIRTRYGLNKYNIYSLGQTFSYNIPATFINLDIEKLILVLEGKSSSISKILIDSIKPLIIIGKSIERRFYSKKAFIFCIKKVFPNANVLDIMSSCNSKGHEFLHINGFNTKSFYLSDVIVYLNLEDNIQTRKLMQNSNKKTIWINTHGSKLASKADIIVPAMTNFETEETFINLEGRPQRTQKTFNDYYFARPIKNIMMALFKESENSNKTLCFMEYQNEIVKAPELLDTRNNFLYNMLISSQVTMDKTKYSSYPIKSSLEDFYLSNNFCKNSIIMNQCSKEIRKISSNFPKI
jgi:NADH-quinone oxidoreductase chain G